jgi:hypothetical protein
MLEQAELVPVAAALGSHERPKLSQLLALVAKRGTAQRRRGHKEMRFLLIQLCAILSVTSIVEAQSEVVTYVNAPRPFRGAQAYKDKASGIIFYVESDGRHIAAIDRDGKLLWNRDPFVEAKLEPYRFERPVIVSIGEPHSWMTKGRPGRYVLINFNSTQAGILSFEKGDFTFLGQD